MPIVKNFFIGLSNNPLLNKSAKEIGPMLGANKVVAGNTITALVDTIERLNNKGITVTVDCLGEFVLTEGEAIQAKDQIIEVMYAIYNHNLDGHMSIKLSQLGSEFDIDLAYRNLREILLKANQFDNMHINIDTEKYDSLFDITQVLDRLKGEFKNVGTVIQAYLYKADALIDKYPELRLRMVKGAYKESDTIAYQTKEEIDKNYIRLMEKRLLNSKNVTSIATHDDEIIRHMKQFIKDNNIEKSRYEFQMLYGFRTDLAEKIAGEGNNFCIYVPYGDDWFSYFMRRLAERPQNLNLMFKEVMKPDILKKVGIVSGAVASFGLATTFIYRIFKK
ncbi:MULTISPECIES: proline dehydrogenase family protein [Staphylococcus]|uniref:proline dehydrogenase n=1 Tax=Staphylococcus xylosus TaxID=1288 RepID=A0A418IM31_STAXY|nr:MULTISPECIES: proline dehydrogenase family protein [Staphylococcus]MBF0814238.1 proline dehydrogenase family protein [Staphylococcus saprophyticus]MDW8542463.1 proline dehydrogenase family protein [Staphylococcus sp. KG4-1]MRF37254.1 proline dehydrogenase [Staphylococcus sp. KY49P]MDW8561841.1 proline dehydrogenase family protein [Staphylococcus sp. KG4-3]NQD99223.1 proline dehydrogenase [Staphylococcus xylosus]